MTISDGETNAVLSLVIMHILLLETHSANDEHFKIMITLGGGFFYASPTRAAPLDTACFSIEDSSRNRFALNGIEDFSFSA